jgi:hypothetical protein
VNGSVTYKSEQKTSIAFAIAFENKTVRQTLVKTVFFHSEFGIRAGRFWRSRRASQKTKAGMRAMLNSNRAMFAGWRILDMALVSVLHDGEYNKANRMHNGA